MSIEKMKLKKHILITMLMAVIITILPAFISSLATKTNAYTFKSISGKTWNTTEKIGGLYEYLYDKSTDRSPSIPSYNDLKNEGYKIGTNLGSTSADEKSFNRKGCLLDFGDEDWSVNMICYHPGTSTWDYGSQEIQQIIIITDEKIEFRKLNSGMGTNDIDEDGSSDSNYNYQKFLSVAYKSQSDFKTAEHFAEYLSGSKKWSDAIKEDTGISVERNKSANGTALDWEHFGMNVKNYRYSGIFVFFSCGGSGIQGRVMYRVIREESTPNIDLKIKKINQNGTALSGATIQVDANYNDSNVKNIFKGDNKISNRKGTISNGSSWDLTIVPNDPTKPVKLKISEKTAPKNYIGVSGEYEITIKYDNSGKITDISGESGNVTVGGKNKDTATVTIKNQYVPPAKAGIYKKAWNDTTTIDNARFVVKLTNVSSFKLKTGSHTSTDFGVYGLNEDNPNGAYYWCDNIKKFVYVNGTNKSTVWIYGIKSGDQFIDVSPYNMNNGEMNMYIYEITSQGDLPDGIPMPSKNWRFYGTNNDTTKTNKVKDVIGNTPGYSKVPSVQKASWKLENAQWKLSSTAGYVAVNNSSLTIHDDYETNISLVKRDSQNPTGILPGATFNITLEGVQSIKGYNNINPDSTILRTNGNLNFEDVVFAKGRDNIVITLEEVSAPVGYKRIEGKIRITIERDGDRYTYSATTVADSKGKNNVQSREFDVKKAAFINNNGHNVAIALHNIPVMNLGGVVFVDGQENEKKYDENEDYNQLYDANEGLEGVQVELIKSVEKAGKYVDEVVKIDAYGRTLMTESAKDGDSYTYTKNNGEDDSVTLNKGQYVFANIEKGAYYAVRFTYDGINYQTIKLSKTPYDDKYKLYSKAAEYDLSNWQRDGKTNEQLNKAAKEARQTFNDRFKTISEGKATKETDETNGTPLYYIAGKGGDYETSTLEVKNNGTNTKNDNKPDFAISAISYRFSAGQDKYWKESWNTNGTIKWDKDSMESNSYQMNINCGLYKKELDLSLGTELVGAKLTINGKETDYIYDDVTIGEAKPNKYNLYLFASDYNFRIDMYKNKPISGDTNENRLEFENATGADFDTSNLKDLELQAKVTYKIKLENATPWHKSRVDQIKYYYDQAFINPVIKSGNYEIESDAGNILILKHKGDSYDLNGDSKYQEIEIEFTVAKDPETNNSVILKDNCTNVAEIIKYTTGEGGLIDRDSAPDNAKVKLENGTPTVEGFDTEKRIFSEDDTWQSNALNIQVKQEQSRTINGTVWDDGRFNEADGILIDGETPVNDVIVQLIEIVEVKDGKMKGEDVTGVIADGVYEYIWQETRSGSKTVKYTPIDGTTPNPKPTYDVTEGEGKYCFNQNIIPGNYIVRFIYGDGTTYDITSEQYKSSAKNVKKYNGQDYKSTIDKQYDTEWYNEAKSKYETKASVARDNEARRLEVMAYSSTIDQKIGEALKDKTTLDKTWMCAETSKINVMIDKDATEGTNKVGNTEFKGNNDQANVTFEDVNFGLALRPETKLVLEKHITGLKITPNGTGVQSIIDAKADIESIVNGDSVSPTGVTQGLATIKSTRGERGFWQVATDIEELAQGAELEVEYTYVIRNDGEKDYLSPILVNAYEGYETNEDGTRSTKKLNKTYKEYLESLKYDTRGKTNTYGDYLGQYYYNRSSEKCAEVTSRVETLEEELNNDLTFDVEGKDFVKKNEESVDKKVYDTDGNEKTEKIETVVQTTSATEFLTTKAGENYEKGKDVDYSKTITLRTVLSSSTGGELGATLPSYIAEITKYSNAAGRRDMSAEPENLSYVHSDDKRMTLDTYKDGNVYYQRKEDGIYKLDITKSTEYEKTDLTEIPTSATKLNQRDEFWGETIIITKPTGEDKITPMQIAIITVSSIAVLGVGIVLIKKFVLKK